MCNHMMKCEIGESFHTRFVQILGKYGANKLLTYNVDSGRWVAVVLYFSFISYTEKVEEKDREEGFLMASARQNDSHHIFDCYEVYSLLYPSTTPICIAILKVSWSVGRLQASPFLMGRLWPPIMEWESSVGKRQNGGRLTQIILIFLETLCCVFGFEVLLYSTNWIRCFTQLLYYNKISYSHVQ